MQLKKYLGVAVVLMVVACNQTTEQAKETKDSTAKQTKVSAVANVSFKDDKLASIYTDYLNLKDALVATKGTEAQAAAKVLASSLKGYNGCEYGHHCK